MHAEKAERFVQQYEALCLKVLRDCRVFSSNPDYEDYLQILRIALFENSLRFADCHSKQVTLIYHFLRWRLRDAQRKQQRQQKILQRAKSNWQERSLLSEDDIEWTDQLAHLWPKLSLGEQRFLYSRIQGLTYQQIRERYHVSAGTVCNWKKRLVQHWTENDEAS